MIKDVALTISEELNLKLNSVSNAIKLIDEGNTIPYIARYKKDLTDSLTDKELRDLEERLKYLRNLNDRKLSVISLIEEKGKLTLELKEEIEEAKTLSEVEDLYRPYKEKRKTKGVIAKEKGLDKIVEIIYKNKKIDNFEDFLKSFLDESKKLNSLEDVYDGIIDIISEDISDKAKYRKYIKKEIFLNGKIIVKEKKKDEKDTYGTYKDFESLIKKIKPYQFLAIQRGEKEKYLSYKLDFDKEKIIDYIFFNYKNSIYKDIYLTSIKESLKRLILPSVENEIIAEIKEKSEEKSLEVFKRNLESLLMYPPLKNKKILGIDPGFKSGCKYAYVDSLSIPHEIGTIYITTKSNIDYDKDKDIKELISLISKYNIDYIALGNGTASRESEEILRKMIEHYNLNIKIFIVNESGASVYSASKLGEEEFPNLTVEKRSAISLARRVIDPLAELVKIEPKAIGVGQYQHDMNQVRLNEVLSNVVMDSVNRVGVNLNTASISLLSYVSGISKSLAKNIYEYRLKNGNFISRNDLLKIRGLKEKTFTQCAGFLKIVDGNEILDNTKIHPDNYKEARLILNKFNIDLTNSTKEEREEKLVNLNIQSFIKENNLTIGKEILEDIIKEIINPFRDIREELEIVALDNNVKSINDLKVGMILNGTIRNIMDFGMFIDINVHQDGLVHISEISKEKYIDDISKYYSINEVVRVKVISLDINKKRIGLSMIIDK